MKSTNLYKTVWLICLLALATDCLFAQFSGGSGTEVDPYQVSTAAQLNDVRNYLTCHFVQINDIDLGIAPYNLGTGWNPIGAVTAFTGVYDGNGHTISNLIINDPSSYHRGLFAKAESGQLKNIRLQGCNIVSSSSSGILVGIATAEQITNCFISGEISSLANDTGGLAGTAKNYTTIQNCETQVTVSGFHYTAGLVGWANFAQIDNCKTVAVISGDDSCGGLVGDSVHSNISNSYAFATLNTLMSTGGLVGMTRSSSNIENCFFSGQISGTEIAGGITGQLDLTSTLTNSYSVASFLGGNSIGGLVSNANPGVISGSYWNTDVSGPVDHNFGEGRTTIEMTYRFAPNTYVGWDFENIWNADLSGNNNSGYPFLWEEPVSVSDLQNPIPIVIVSSFPNPFTERVTFNISLKSHTVLSIKLYDLKGRVVKERGSTPYSKGTHNISMDTNDLSNGIYLLQVKAGSEIITKKITCLK